MDPISASSFNLNEDSESDDDRLRRILGSKTSLGRYEERNLKNILPQITAAAISSSSHLVMGLSLVFSAILIPQLEEKNSSIQTTREHATWTASVLMVVAPVGAIITGYLMDRIGRLNTLKVSAIPGVIGFMLIGSAQNISTIIVGRMITGLAMISSTGPAIVFITEISRKDMRGSLVSLGPGFVSVGMILGFIQGWLLGWRILAWLCIVYTMIPFFLLFLLHESPSWLVTRGRDLEAKKSLSWLHKHQPQQSEWGDSFADLQLKLLQREHQAKVAKNRRKGGQHPIRGFLKPTGYKPLAILIGMFFFQQFSGIYIFIFHAVIFLEAAGVTINPYKASIFIGVIRLVMSFGNPWLLRLVPRRICLMASALGMAFCMFVSGLFTFLIEHGVTNVTWVPVVFLLLYTMFAMFGFLTIPWTMTAEFFPIEIRSMAYSVTTVCVNVLMFAAVQSYTFLDYICGGSAGIQWFFSIISLFAFIYTLVFVPETHKKNLSEMQDYFEQNTVYFGQNKPKNNVKVLPVVDSGQNGQDFDGKLAANSHAINLLSDLVEEEQDRRC